MVFLPHWPPVKESRSIKYDLSRIELLLNILDNPQLRIPPVIHVAGTNGKGSTIAFIRSILECCGLKTHVFTSPHLKRFNERIVLAGSEITDDYLYTLVEECRIASEKHSLEPSFFEVATTVAFLAFSRINADFTLLEVGIGGRLDATNVIKNPIMSVITPISYDHMDILGNSLEEIALEKSGIIKSHVPCVVSLQTPEVHDVIECTAKTKQVKLIRFEYDFGVSIVNDLLHYKSDTLNIVTPRPSLLGYHQYINAATAIAVVNNLYNIKVLKILDSCHIKQGITNTKWEGRLQCVSKGKINQLLPKNWELLVDSAHNNAGAQAIASWLRDQEKVKTYCIVGMTKNRNIYEFAKKFEFLVSEVICVSIDSEPFNYQALEMLQILKQTKLSFTVSMCNKVDDAIRYILNKEINLNEKIRILITGSIFLVSDFILCNQN